MSTPNWQPWPKHWPRRWNGGVECDMLVGPCACGATHTKEEHGRMSFEPWLSGYPDAEPFETNYRDQPGAFLRAFRWAVCAWRGHPSWLFRDGRCSWCEYENERRRP